MGRRRQAQVVSAWPQTAHRLLCSPNVVKRGGDLGQALVVCSRTPKCAAMWRRWSPGRPGPRSLRSALRLVHFPGGEHFPLSRPVPGPGLMAEQREMQPLLP